MRRRGRGEDHWLVSARIRGRDCPVAHCSAPVPHPASLSTPGARAAFGIAGPRPFPEEFMKRALVVFAALAGWPLAALAQTQADPVEVPAHETPALDEASDGSGSDSGLGSADAVQARAPRWGLTTTLGFGGSGGDFGDLLTKPQSGDYNIFRNNGAW